MPEQLHNLSILWQGRNPNWMGDQYNQVLLEVTPELGISILGASRRVDSHYGLPHQEDADFSAGPQKILQELNKAVSASLFELAVVRFEQGASRHPSGLRFRPVGYKGCGSASGPQTPQQFLQLLERVQELGLEGIQADAQWDEDARRLQVREAVEAAINEGQIKLHLQTPKACRADPHPVSQPAHFVVCNIPRRGVPLTLEDVGTLRGVYVWCEPQGTLHCVAINRDTEGLAVYSSYPKEGDLAACMQRYGPAFQEFLARLS